MIYPDVSKYVLKYYLQYAVSCHVLYIVVDCTYINGIYIVILVSPFVAKHDVRTCVHNNMLHLLIRDLKWPNTTVNS